MWTKWSAVNEWRLLEPKSESKSEAFFLSPEWSASTTCLCIDGSVANSVNSRPALWNESYWLLYLQIIINKVIGGQLNREYQLWRWDFERNAFRLNALSNETSSTGKHKQSFSHSVNYFLFKHNNRMMLVALSVCIPWEAQYM